MNRTTIYTRTAKGDGSTAAAPNELASDLRDILNAIDGKSSIEALGGKLSYLSEAELEDGLTALALNDLICEAPSSMSAFGTSSSRFAEDSERERRGANGTMPERRSARSTPSNEYQRRADDLRAKIKAKREGVERPAPASDTADSQRQDQARRAEEEQRAAAERARQEAEAQVRRMAEEQARRGVAEEEARRKAEERLRQEAEDAARETAERARQDAEDRARRDAEVQAAREAEEAARRAEERVRQEAEDWARRDAEDRARGDADEAAREAVERARQQAEDLARRDAAERAGREAEEDAARKDAERAREEAEERERQAIEEEAWRYAQEEAARKAAEPAPRQAPHEGEDGAGDEAAERARLRAEAQARLMAEEAAWLETEEQIRLEEGAAGGTQGRVAAGAQAGKAGPRKPRRWGKVIAVGLGSLLLAGLVAIHLISFDEQIPQFEKLAAAQFQRTVKIKGLHLSLLPQPHLRFDGVSIGSEGQITVAQIKAAGDLRNLFNEKKVFKSIELDSPVFTEEGLSWILFGKPLTREVVLGQVSALNATLESKNIKLPAFDAKLQSDVEDVWKTIAIESVDKSFSMELVSKGESLQIDVKAKSFKIPFGSTLTLDELEAKGTADSAGLALTEFKGFIYGGTLSGTARLKWATNWTLAGELNAKQIDTTRLVPELLTGGRLAGTASYAMQAPQAAQLFAAPHVEGSFAIPWGTLLGVDLGRMLQGGERRGETKFTELAGSFVHDRGATQLRQLRLSQTTMSASGTVDIDPDKNIRGRLAADLKLSTELRRANIGVSGTLGNLEWRRQ